MRIQEAKAVSVVPPALCQKTQEKPTDDSISYLERAV